MQFEKSNNEGFREALVLESADDEVEAVAAANRELVYIKARDGRVDQIQKHELEFSMWGNQPNRTILTNYPLSIARMLEDFHDRTGKIIEEITMLAAEPAFDSDAIARRIILGEKAFTLAGLIKVEFDNDTLHQMLDDQGIALFAEGPSAPRHPYD